MECENIFCVYQKDNKCKLDKITLDIQGNCTSCIYVNINEKTLDNYKNEYKDN